jgi:hypothetical protein
MNYLDFGDLVSVQVDPVNRECGYNPCPDGTIGKVVGFGEVRLHAHDFTDKPGVYRNRYYPIIRVGGAGGKQLDPIWHGHLVPLNDISGRAFLASDDFLRPLGDS